jgi:hypothetical protein
MEGKSFFIWGQFRHVFCFLSGILETRSFLFFYDEDDDKENKSSKSSKVQRSHSDRATTRKAYHTQKSVSKTESLKFSENNKDVPARAKCPKIEAHAHAPPDTNNKNHGHLHNHHGSKAVHHQALPASSSSSSFSPKKAQDDAVVPPLQLKKKDGPRNPHAKPLKAALVNAKYVTYGRVTKDLAVLLFTSADSLMRRFYLIKIVETFAETLGITLTNLGIDTDKFQLNWTKFVKEFQTHMLYGFLVGVLVAMANTDVAELNEFIRHSDHPDKREVSGPTVKPDDAELNNR